MKWPPLLNLAKDRPHIDTSFQNWEKVNGPYLNSMIQPVWTKSDGRKTVYSKNGNKFYVENNHLYMNDEVVESPSDIISQKFVRNKLDTPSTTTAAIQNGNIWSLRDLGIYYNDSLVSTLRSLSGNILDARFFVNDRSTILVIVIQNASDTRMRVYRLTTSNVVLMSNTLISWYANYPGEYRNLATTADIRELSNLKADPIITGYYTDSLEREGSTISAWCISLTSIYGEVEDTKRHGFSTFVIDLTNDVVLPVAGFKLPTTEQPSGITQTTTKTVFFTTEATDTSVTKLFLTKDNSTYYEYLQNSANPVGPIYVFPVNVIPTSANRAIVVGEETYYVYSVVITYKTRTVILSGDPGEEYTFGAYISNQVPLGQIEVTSGTLSQDTREIYKTDTGEVRLTYVLTQYNTQANISAGWAQDRLLYFRNRDIDYSPDPLTYLNNNQGYSFDLVETGTTFMGSSIVPNIAMDDGAFYSLWSFDVNTETAVEQNQRWDPIITLDCPLVTMKAVPESLDSNNFLTMSRTNMVYTNQFANGCTCARSNSFTINQGLFIMTAKFNNIAAANPRSLSSSGNEMAGSTFSEWTYNNRYGFRYLPGTARLSSFNYYSHAVTGDPTLTGASEDLLVYTVGGYRSRIGTSPFYLLYNVTSSGFAYLQGISYARAANNMGTLIAPWESIDEVSYVSADDTSLLYKDKAGDWYRIDIENGNELTTLLDDRYVFINTVSYFNLYDSEEKRWYHYASDYNGRLFHGQNTNAAISGVLSTSSNKYAAYPYMRYTANAINPLYQVMPRDPVTSIILPITARYRCGVGNELLFDCLTNYYNGIQGVDIFWSEYSNTVCKYQRTMNLLDGLQQVYVKSELTGLIYPGSTSSSATLTPNVFTKYIDGAGNNDMVIENYDSYVLTYYDNKPYFIYSASTQVSTTFDERNEFFVLQGQFYGVIGDKLYSLIYSNGAISQMDAIIDVRGLIYCGNTPMIAFFYDPAHKVLKSFTGDANLETLYSATKLSGLSELHFYDTQTQSIYIPTSSGLLVIGPRNMYMFEQWKDVTLVQFDENGITHITNGNETISLVYYERDGYSPVVLDLESSFYGYGATENISIDRWNITVYDPDGNHKDSYVTVGVRSLTDISVKSEEKTYKITPNMYDKWSNSVLISFNPTLIKAQGIRLYVKTPLVVQSITAHVMDNRTGTLTKHSL